MRYYKSQTLGKILLRGDSEGAVKAWIVPNFSIEEIISMKAKKDFKPDCKFESTKTVWFFGYADCSFFAGIQPFISTSVSKAWKAIKPPPVGILDQLVSNFEYFEIS